MSVYIAGSGWVTPLGAGVDEVWERLTRGDRASAEAITDAHSPVSYQAFKVPASALTGLPLHPRLRRASAISRFAAAAGLGAIKDAQDRGFATDPARMALVFAISNGGVIYTKRFYDDVVRSGAASASPILFPETVFNAPASHLAALLNLSGQSYTLVGDGSVGLSALNMAESLLANEKLEACLVVGAEEIDWLLCDAYARWRLLKKPAAENHSAGMILSEGAGAILLARKGGIRLDKSHAPIHYQHRRELESRLSAVLKRLGPPSGSLVIGSSNGTFIDRAETAVLKEMMPEGHFYTPKAALGESVGASGLWQTIVAVKALQTRQLPPDIFAGPANESRILQSTGAAVISCGLNQGVAALSLSA
jgi:3-oxoacyl-(acyl-carrier-protein) synthase